uniref:Alpha/beta hydrolase fold-3 domain-containing protein n=1 Tax=Leersia perrieri TaxID=77586 RepID=A0A0D9XEJ8_9ORYZ
MATPAPESSRRLLFAALLTAPLAALLFHLRIPNLTPAMDAASASEIEFDMPGVIRVYKDGRVERFDGTETVPPSPSGDPAANGVVSKDVVLDPAAGISARLYLHPGVEPGKKLPVVLFFHGGAFLVHTSASTLYHKYAASLAAAPWLAAHGDASRIVLAGDSAGANMAHNAAIRLRKEGIEGFGNKVSGVILLHPYFWGKDPIGGEPTDAGYRGSFHRTWEFVTAGTLGLDHPSANPAASPEEWRQLGAGRVLVTTAEQCWFVERARAYAEGIKKCGWDGEVEFHETKGEGHVFFLPKPDCDNAVKELAVVTNFIRRC